MTTITLTPTGQRLEVPTSWADVPLSVFVNLLAPVEGEPRTAAELLLGLGAGALNQLAADDVVYLSTLLQFSEDVTPVTELLPLPDLPDPGALPWNCVVLCQEQFAALAERPLLAALPYVLAVYRCQLLHGNTSRIAEIEAALLVAPCTEVYAEALAFTMGSRHLLNGTAPNPKTRPITPTKKSTRGWRSWLRASV